MQIIEGWNRCVNVCQFYSIALKIVTYICTGLKLLIALSFQCVTFPFLTQVLSIKMYKEENITCPSEVLPSPYQWRAIEEYMKCTNVSVLKTFMLL